MADGSQPSGVRVLPARHARLTALRRLSRRRSARSEAGLAVVEGPTLVTEAHRAGLAVTFVVAPDDERGRAALDALPADLAPDRRHLVAPGVFDGLTTTATPQALVALVERPGGADRPDALGDLAVVLAGVADPGNVGTIVRTAEATGATSVVVVAPTADAWSPKTVRASAGSVFRMPVLDRTSEALVAEAGEAGIRLVGLDAEGTPIDQADLDGPLALVVGSESHGLAPDLVPALDLVVALPMAGRVDSLNAAVAASVVLYEVARRRRCSG